MMVSQLIDEHVSLKQCKSAVEALHAYATKQQAAADENELLPGKEQHVWLQVTVKRMNAQKKIKPVKIPIAHPIVDPRTTGVCLIVKDPQREYKDLLEEHKIKFVSRVVGIAKLKGKWKPFEARRLLLKENGLFLADERVVPLLPGLLGSKWFAAKKQPIPVCMTRKDLKGELERAISSTYFHQNQGTCTSIKIGSVSQSSAQILANLQAALPSIIKHISDGWDNVQILHIKTSSSVALPIWTCGLEERWEGAAAVSAKEGQPQNNGSGGGLEDEEVAPEPKPKKKRKDVDIIDETQEKPKKKKLKASDDTNRSSLFAVKPTSSPDESSEGRKSKKKKVDPADTVATSSQPTKSIPSITSGTTNVAAGPEDAPLKKSKKHRNEANGEVHSSTKAVLETTLTHDQLKHKRALAGGADREKKKERLGTAKAGKSTKDKLLGKKVARD